VDDYRKCAVRAKAAGFDGVEVHAAGGYLLDQFLQRSTNHSRTDRYGDQSLENRARLTLEVVDAVRDVFPAHRVGVRLAPNRDFGGMGKEDNSDVFLHVMRELGVRKVAYVALQDGEGAGVSAKTRFITSAEVKQAFGGIVMANFGYDRESAEAKLRNGEANFVGFGRWFMSNPDLVERFRSGTPLRPMLAYEFFYDATKGDEGYTKLPNEKETTAP
jgi:N-ethylmaleimide reductase